MNFQNIQLDTTNHSSLDIYQSNTDIVLPGIVVVGGGSYKQLRERDTERVALQFATQAFQSFVVNYPTEEQKSYAKAKEAIVEAFDYIKKHADQLKVDLNKLGIIGFSAGGQLAADYSNQIDTQAKFALLGYPVIKPTLDEKMGVQSTDVSKLVSPNTPPTFVWGAMNDGLTPFLEHIDVYTQALAQNSVPFEVHEFSTGNHGMALANKWTGVVNDGRVDHHMSRWFPLAVEWLDEMIGIK
ncbi:alpha/beta hydrolase [Tetragenococcus halophilus]|uniref:Alpha/beta hydrolase fold domain-containing protein n=2 Tax=Tetragenococcus halophilus TaxID=51669 RepID=A0AB37D6S2_TETHA|nr:alpha/beta hydrolase [Tetragenococcus halophilus]MCF1602740.1 alpha/beta hydrolase [Tetragenococcus halophilus]MCO7026960.1 alpha/beta hydrolase [Tetragenococcus halophilus]MCO8293753.1 alpha/beta hydrolase [Tetragenococcus halophilus]MCT8311062.1 alpha/beta hydrolase [Tetragenococcus halophilus]MDN6113511.1 alpha/beta hydrolase [Tetragenococcus halophilus]